LEQSEISSESHEEGDYLGGHYFDSDENEADLKKLDFNLKNKKNASYSDSRVFFNICTTNEGGLNVALYFAIILMWLFNSLMLFLASKYWLNNPDLLRNNEPGSLEYTHCLVYYKLLTED
jgi:hypothetical protein